MLSVEDLVAGYGRLQVLSGVTMEARPGVVTVIVGPNGSGKSTLLKSICGLTSIYSGTIHLESQLLSGMSAYQIARDGVAYLPQTESVFTNLTLWENLKLAGYTVEKREYEVRIREAFEMFPQLKPYVESKTANLSGGERQMLAMAMAMIRKPKVMMFDEPTGNLAPKIATQVLGTIASLARAVGLTVLLVEQNARRALEIGDKAYLLVSGKSVFSGACKDLLEHKELGRLYLGLRAS